MFSAKVICAVQLLSRLDSCGDRGLSTAVLKKECAVPRTLVTPVLQRLLVLNYVKLSTRRFWLLSRPMNDISLYDLINDLHYGVSFGEVICSNAGKTLCLRPQFRKLVRTEEALKAQMIKQLSGIWLSDMIKPKDEHEKPQIKKI